MLCFLKPVWLQIYVSNFYSCALAETFSRFLLAQLHLCSLAKKQNRRDARMSLQDLPKELWATYDEIIRRIWSQDAEDVSLARRVLLWISSTHRPLTLVELQHALAVALGDRRLDEEALIDEDFLVGVCAGIVAIDGRSGIIRLVHHTAQEYLLHIRNGRFPTAHIEISRTCLTYLSFDEIASSSSHDPSDFSRKLTEFPFLDYACHFWGLHLKLAADEEAEEKAFEFCCDNRSLALVGNSVAFWRHGPFMERPRQFNMLHVTASYGLKRLSQLLVEGTNINLNMTDDFGRTPISLATSKGHLEMVNFLLGLKEINVNAGRNTHVGSVLHVASGCGYTETVSKILQLGGDVASLTARGLTPLHVAAENGNKETIRLLLAAKSDARAASISGTTPLYRSARSGSLETVKLLVKEDGNVNVTTWDFWTPLHEAVECDHYAIAEYLVSAGADPTRKSLNGQSPIDLAQMLQRYQFFELFQIAELQKKGQFMKHLPIRPVAHKTYLEEVSNLEPIISAPALRRPRCLSEGVCDVDQLTDISASLKASTTDVSTQLLQMYPHLELELVERLADAQIRRCSALLKLKLQHFSEVGDTCYNAGSSCAARSKSYAVATDQDFGIPVHDPYIVDLRQPSQEIADLAKIPDLPRGVPPPPPGSSSTEVECPVCFELKVFPSLDSWIKHVYEDIQPYICTFSNCSRPLVFKRRADWMRHENGWHREVVRYTCHIGDCIYSTVCRNNFHSHMHTWHQDFIASLPPHTRKRQSDSESDGISRSHMRDQMTVIDEFLVDPRDLSSEPCKFCGRFSSTWSDYETHVSGHFEELGIKVLDLVARSRF